MEMLSAEGLSAAREGFAKRAGASNVSMEDLLEEAQKHPGLETEFWGGALAADLVKGECGLAASLLEWSIQEGEERVSKMMFLAGCACVFKANGDSNLAFQEKGSLLCRLSVLPGFGMEIARMATNALSDNVYKGVAVAGSKHAATAEEKAAIIESFEVALASSGPRALKAMKMGL